MTLERYKIRQLCWGGENDAPGPMWSNGTSDPPYVLIYLAYLIFGLHDDIYVIYIYDKHD